MKRIKQVGFTLIELLVTITIIALLMSIGVVSYRQASRNARNSKRATDMETVRQALVLYRSDNGAYPTSAEGVTNFDSLVTYLRPDYLSANNIEDPKVGDGNYYYSYVSSGTTFSVCYREEPDEIEICVYNP